jgi:hypothetical protein
MDERFRGKGIWIGLGALVIIFLCLMMCGFGAMVTMATRSSSAYGVVPQVQPPTAEEASAAPPAYYGHGPVGMGRHGGFSPIRFVFLGGGLLFLGTPFLGQAPGGRGRRGQRPCRVWTMGLGSLPRALGTTARAHR